MIAALLLALAAPLNAEAPEAAVGRVMARVEKLVAAQAGKDAREIRDRDRDTENLAAELKPFGRTAVAPLSTAALDMKRPAKVRLFAVSFLALTRDPTALPPLENILLNPEQSPFVRALAAQSLPGLGAPDAVVGRALCAALDQEDLPREVLSEVVLSVARLGCPDPSALKRIARSFGPHPRGENKILAEAARRALGAGKRR